MVDRLKKTRCRAKNNFEKDAADVKKVSPFQKISYIITAMLKLLIYVFACIPHFAVMMFARILFPFVYRAAKKRKWGLRAGKIIPKVFKDRGRQWYEQVLRQNTLHLLKFAGEMLKARFASDRSIYRKCYIKEGGEYLQKMMKGGTGFTILTCHLGNWEWSAAYIALLYDCILYAPVFVESSKGNEVLNWAREKHRIELLKTGRDSKVSLRTLFRMIELVKKGKVVYLVADQAALGGDYRGTLFGTDLRFFGGPFIVGQKTHTPFLPMYNLRDEKNRIALYFERPFYLNGDDLDQDISKVTDFFERNIGVHPEQYLWSQDRW